MHKKGVRKIAITSQLQLFGAQSAYNSRSAGSKQVNSVGSERTTAFLPRLLGVPGLALCVCVYRLRKEDRCASLRRRKVLLGLVEGLWDAEENVEVGDDWEKENWWNNSQDM